MEATAPAANSQKKDAPHYIFNVVASSRFAAPIELRAFIAANRDDFFLADVSRKRSCKSYLESRLPCLMFFNKEVSLKKWSFALIAILLFTCHSAWAGGETWKVIELNKTTESDVIFIFGRPDLVDIQCSYDELKAAMESDGKVAVSAYALHYTPFHGDLNILNGPLGKASSVDVVVQKGVVVEVKWDYDGIDKPRALQAWASDPTFQTGGVRPGLRLGQKDIGDSTMLYIYCYQNDKGVCGSAITADMIPKVPK